MPISGRPDRSSFLAIKLHNFSSPGLLKSRTIRTTRALAIRFITGPRFCCDSFSPWIVLRSFRHCIRALCRTDMDNIEQAQQMIPFITCEISFGQDVSELVFGVDVFDLDVGVQIDSIEQPSKRNSVRSWKHCLIVGLLTLMIILITAWLSSNTYNKASWREDWTFEGTQINILHHIDLPVRFLISVNININKSPCSIWDTLPKTETIRSHNSRAGNPSNLNTVSKEMISDSVELCETAVCFLHIQLIGTNVWLPQMHNVPPEVDFESSRSPAKSESWNSPSLHCLAVLPTWQYCPYSHVWWKMKSIDSGVCHRLWSIS